jgi:hypothetical protein
MHAVVRHRGPYGPPPQTWPRRPQVAARLYSIPQQVLVGVSSAMEKSPDLVVREEFPSH